MAQPGPRRRDVPKATSCQQTRQEICKQKSRVRKATKKALEMGLESRAPCALKVWPRSSGGRGIGREIARDVLPGRVAADQDAVEDNRLSPDHDRHRPARHLQALVGCVVRAVVQNLLADGGLAVGVPDGDVGVGADGNSALAWMQPVHLGVIGGAQGHEVIEADAALHHTLREQNWKPRLHARYAVRYPAETGAPLG